ncbi:MAG: arginase family protein [Deltaproteobacteria bacterium]|nr:arginase family protein [Deltaproteobacteria bacterium]
MVSPKVNFISCPFNCGYPNLGTGLGSMLLSNHFKSVNYEIFDEWIPCSYRHRYQLTAAVEFKSLFEKSVKNLEFSNAVILNGDHFSSFFSISKALEVDPDLTLIWIDPDFDLNTPYSSPTGNLHGMTVAHLLGHGYRQLHPTNFIKNQRLYYVLSNDPDPGELSLMRKYQFFSITPQQLLRCKISGSVYISLDFDCIHEFEAVSRSAKAIFNFKDICEFLKRLLNQFCVRWIDFNEFNPYFDPFDKCFKMATNLISLVTDRLR